MIKFLLSGLIFLLSLVLIGQNLDKPFWGEHDWNGARYGNIARNYVRYGLLETKFGQVENSGIARVGEFEYYTHYPPLLPILIALSYKIFGISEWSTRLVPLLATSGSLVLIFLIGSKLWNLSVGIFAAVLALATPMVLYFGKNASHEPLTLFFILFAFFGFIQVGKIKNATLIFTLGLILAELTAWAGYFLVPAITLVCLLKRDFKILRFIVPFWLLSFLMFVVQASLIFFATGSFFGGNLIESLFQRSGLTSTVQPTDFSLFGYFDKLRLWFSTTFTITLVTLSILWLISMIFIKLKYNWYILILWMVGLIYIITFPNAVFIHNYLILYFLPALSLSVALMLFSLRIKYDRLVYHTKFKRVYFIFFLTSIILVAFERRAFLTALNNSQYDRLAVEIGMAINKNSEFDDLILISPLRFSYSADKFLRFYSDRILIYSDDVTLDHDVLVLVDQQEGKFEIIRR